MSQIIHTRTNLMLWLLTGRSADFQNDPLNTGIEYSVRDTPVEVKSLRKFLQLDDTTTDFYVLSVLAALKTSTAFGRLLPMENDGVFVDGFTTLSPITSTHTLLPPNAHAWPSISGGPGGAKGFQRVSFTKLDSSSVLIRTDNGLEEESGFGLFEDDAGTYRLVIDKAEDYGVRAHFRVTAWDVSDTVTVTVSPTRYPFAAVVAQIDRNTEALNLMTSEGTLQAYAETSNPMRKVGMLGLAIVRRMIKFLNTNQAAVSVRVTTAEDLSKSYEFEPAYVPGLEG